MGNLDNVKLVCLGFDLSIETKENVLIVFKKLLDEVPYDAFIEINLSKIPTGFEGRIAVSSIAGDFMSAQSDLTPQVLVEKLEKNLRKQLAVWRTTRFTNVPPKPMASII